MQKQTGFATLFVGLLVGTGVGVFFGPAFVEAAERAVDGRGPAQPRTDQRLDRLAKEIGGLVEALATREDRIVDAAKRLEALPPGGGADESDDRVDSAAIVEAMMHRQEESWTDVRSAVEPLLGELRLELEGIRSALEGLTPPDRITTPPPETNMAGVHGVHGSYFTDFRHVQQEFVLLPQEAVLRRLGKPSAISHSDGSEYWRYNLPEGAYVRISFKDRIAYGITARKPNVNQR